jgi:hypothetical protein
LLKKSSTHCTPNKIPLPAVVSGLLHSLAPDFVEQVDLGQPGFEPAQNNQRRTFGLRHMPALRVGILMRS